MRIAQISTLFSPVCRFAKGSIESLVWALTHELIQLGHEVTVFGLPDSQTEGELVAPLAGTYGANGSPYDWELCEWINLCEAVRQSHRFDVLHAHAYLWSLPLDPLSQAPMIHTLHVTPYHDFIRLWERSPNACVTAISQSQWSAFPNLRPAAVIPHGCDTSLFTFNAEPGDYVCYLGRFIPDKGPLQAIEAARALGVRLVMAGPANAYFEERVKPLVDGKFVEYAGFVQGADRDKLLGGAKALLYPIQYQEPFGLVLVEAMLCGTPVAAMGLGAVPEIVDQDITGHYAKTWEEFLQIIPRTLALDRRRVRQQAEARFSAEQMAHAYVQLYKEIIAGKNRV